MPSDRVRSVNGMLTNGSASNGKAGNGARSNSTEPVAIPRRTLKIKPLHQLTKPVLQPDRATAAGGGAAAGGAGAGEEGNESDEKRKGPGGSSALVSPPLPSIDSFAHTRRLQSLSSFKPRSRLLGRQSQGGEVGEKGGATAVGAAAGVAGPAGATAGGGASAAGSAGNPSGKSIVSFSSRASQLQQRQQPLVMGPFRVPRRLNANAAELSAREDTSCTTAATGASNNGDRARTGPLGGRVAGDGEGVARDGFRRLQKGGRGGLAGSATAAAPGVDQMRSDQVEDEIEGFSVGESEGRREGEGFGRAGMLTESSRGGGTEVGRDGDGGMQGKRKRRKIVLCSDGSDGDYEEEEEEEGGEEWGEEKKISPFKRADDAATVNARRFFGVRQPQGGPIHGGPQIAPGQTGAQMPPSSSAAVQRAERDELRARLLALHAPSKGWRSARDPGAVEEKGTGTGTGTGTGKGKGIAAALKQKLLLSAGRKQGEKGEMGGLGEKGKRGLEGGYAETDESAARLISQDDVSAACGESVQLKGYQLVGVNFLLLLYRQKVGGAILADEMGLGKTVQAVVLLGLLGHLDNNPGPHLVVAPASLLDNWQRELQLWCPQLRVVLYHGGQRTALRELYGGKGKKGKKGKKERRRERRKKAEGGGEGSGGEGEEEEEEEGGKMGFDVLLTCYSLFERDSAAQRDDRKFLRRFRFSCVLMDEAHLLKDRSSQRAMKLRQLAQAADYRLMLTGTPLQNDLQELWSLLEFFMPAIFTAHQCDIAEHLGKRDHQAYRELWSLLEFLMPAIFTAHQCDIAEYLGKRDQPSQKGGGGGGPADEGLIGRMKAILGPFVLRRVKADVMKQLVAKVQKVELLPMEGEQATAYNEAVEQYRRAVAARAGGGDREGKSKEEGEGGGEGEGGTAAVAAAVDAMPRRQLASIFTHLRKLANNPLLVRRLFSDEAVDEMSALANHPLLVRRLFSDAAVDEMAVVLHGRGVFGGECTWQRVEEELRGYSDFTLNQLCAAHSDALSHFLLSREQFFHSCKCQVGVGKDIVAWKEKVGLGEELRGYSDFPLNQLCAAHSDALSHFLLSRDQFFHSCKCQVGVVGMPGLPLTLPALPGSLLSLVQVPDGAALSERAVANCTQVVQRQALVDEFNRDPSVFAMLLSTRAGGQGLNLTGADTVILHDVDFNPQMDRQAEDRCHRIGQTRPVTVVRLVARATVDEGILNIAQRKLSLDAALLSGGGEGGSSNGKGSEKGKGGSEEAQSMAAILSSILASKS
ncbi:unnamed protein product [Closterium sp. NIES-64]|nr:unnamed protein product [Closterium sp. NIES-64]